MALTKIGNLKGPQGAQGPRGLPGASDVAADPAMAAYVEADDSMTGPAVQARIDRSVSPVMQGIFAPSSADVGALDLEAYLRERVTGVPSTPKHIWFGYEMQARWKVAVDRVLGKTGSAKVLCIGDSTTWGTGSSGSYANQYSWPTVAAQRMFRSLADTIWGLSIPPSDNQPLSDPRWVLGTGWARATETVGLGGRFSAWKGTPGSGPLTFLDSRILANRYDIYYTANQSSAAAGTFTAQVGTGDPLVVSTHRPTGNTIMKATVIAPSPSTSEPVRITNTGAAGNVWIIGVEPYMNGDNRIRVGNAGVAASSTSSWLSGAATWNVLAFLPAYQPDLTIIDLGINDAGNDTTVANFITRVQTLADAAYAAGSAVLIKTMIPSSGVRSALEQEYADALRTLSPRYAVLDLFNHYGSHARNDARGWMSDWGHGNDLMYQDVGERVAEMLIRYS